MHGSVTDVEYKIAQASLATLSAEKYAALIVQAEEFGIDDLALLAAHNKNLVRDQAMAEKDALQAAKDAKIAQDAQDVEHRKGLLTSLDTHIGLVKTAISTASGAEKIALGTQLQDLQKQRNDAYLIAQQDILDAKQVEIDAVAALIETASGAELAALKATHALLLAEFGAFVTGINEGILNIGTGVSGGNRGDRVDDPGGLGYDAVSGSRGRRAG